MKIISKFSLLFVISYLVFASAQIKHLTWKETTSFKGKMFIADSEVLPDTFDGIDVKLVNTSYKDTFLYDPKFIGLDYELSSCPQEEKMEKELYVNLKTNKNSTGKLSYIKVGSSCKIFITLISPFINQASPFAKTTSSK